MSLLRVIVPVRGLVLRDDVSSQQNGTRSFAGGRAIKPLAVAKKKRRVTEKSKAAASRRSTKKRILTPGKVDAHAPSQRKVYNRKQLGGKWGGGAGKPSPEKKG